MDVVATLMTRGTLFKRLLVGYRFLRQTRQRVVLPHDTYDGAAFPTRGDEGRRHPSDAPLDPEAVAVQLVSQQLRRFVLYQAELSKTPYRVADLDDALAVPL